MSRVVLAGRAFDFCVLWSAEDARRLTAAGALLANRGALLAGARLFPEAVIPPDRP